MAARLGAIVFRNRGWLPVVALLVPLLWPAQTTAWHWIAGALLVAAGELTRLAGVAAAGTVTRRRSRTVKRLVTHGIFAWVRNPLYVGNFLAWMGFTVMSGALWFLPVAAVVFAIEYTLIVRYEEGVLESIFEREYLRYKKRTARWLPQRPAVAAHGTHRWGDALRSEVSTLLAYAVLMVAFGVKQVV